VSRGSTFDLLFPVIGNERVLQEAVGRIQSFDERELLAQSVLRRIKRAFDSTFSSCRVGKDNFYAQLFAGALQLRDIDTSGTTKNTFKRMEPTRKNKQPATLTHRS